MEKCRMRNKLSQKQLKKKGRGSQRMQPIRDLEKLEEVKAYLRASSYRDYFCFHLGCNTGFRIGDLVNLRVCDVRNKTHIIVQEEKTGKMRRAFLNETLRAEIAEYTRVMADDDWLFPSNREGRPLCRIHFYRMVRCAGERAGLSELGSHTMRKTFGYHFYKKTKDIGMLMQILNHSNETVTMRYIGILEDEIDQALSDFSL
ncbi:site-specific integrase [Paenibacillus ehimensis]|uniref:Site-specific integrase n=1 Tax=Paenibacillus ehimensis TaxID=79264 RepID=A0ABT8VMB5_9BACL|nr:site-specific integrase [Paenibacillus ehimensis]MDO3682097.1 site-specific integrase [Paenibacillus ehimensis]